MALQLAAHVGPSYSSHVDIIFQCDQALPDVAHMLEIQPRQMLLRGNEGDLKLDQLYGFHNPVSKHLAHP